jgi:acyl carrier protein
MKTVFGLDGDVPDDISPGTCDKWDSMNHVQLVISLEAEFNVSFEPEDIAEMKTLDEIERKIGLLK